VASVQLRPLGIGEILDVAMKIVWRNAGTLVRAVLVIVLPVQIVSTIITQSSVPKGWTVSASPIGFAQPQPGQTITGAQATTLFTGLGIAGLLTVVAGLLASGACFRAIASAYLGEPTNWLDSLRFAARRFGPLVWLTFLSFLFALLGFVACVIPGIYLWIGFAVAVPVLLTENLRGTKALGRSRALVSGSWWRVLGVIMLGAILTSIVAYALIGIVFAATSIDSGSNTIVVAVEKIVSGTISSAITTPFVAAFTAVLYFDLRVRKEGFDLQLLAERLGVDPPEGYQPLPAATGQSAQPPYWPPPPGWQPGPFAAPAPQAAPRPGPADPPFWPPPPGWKPPGGEA
jgi:hypothetical protein